MPVITTLSAIGDAPFVNTLPSKTARATARAATSGFCDGGRMSRPSLYDAAGGAPAMRALAADFHARCLADPVLAHPFSHGVNPSHVQRLADYWGEVLGGPPTYSSEFGGQEAMIRLHAHQGADAEFGGRFVACFVAAVDSAGLPRDPEFRAALTAYMTWATRDVLSFAPKAAVIPPGLRVPRWDWDGLLPG
jgi:hemoglobin